MAGLSKDRSFCLTRRQMLLGSAAMLAGCRTPAVRTQSPDALETAMQEVPLVRDYAVPFGVHPLQIESAGLVVNLPGTGGDPPPSTERKMVMDEMQKRMVENPNQILASRNTTVVIARANMEPGVQKGDRFDIDVWVTPGTETTSLRGGMLLEARLRELAVSSGRIHEGHTMGLARGPILVDPLAEEDESRTLQRRGRILGGGVCIKARPLGLMLKQETRSVQISSRIGDAINRRFSTHVKGTKMGVATPKTDGYIELMMHPRYRGNVARYLQVLRSVAVRENSAQRLARIKVLSDQIHDPITAATAALRLEAIGNEGIDPLKSAIDSGDVEVRFHACQALAYLDETIASAPLAKIAREVPSFRAEALTALSAMDDPFARDELAGLLDAGSVETRYGAFRALTQMNGNDPLVRGEDIGGQFSYHVIETTAEPMIHVARSFRPEVVVFGENQRLVLPVLLDPGKNLMVTSTPEGELSVACFQPGEVDQRRVIPNRLDALIRTLVELGGSYPEVVHALVQAKQSQALACRLEIDALPQPGRRFERKPADESSDLAAG